ncbi:S1 family peptidase [Nonomuraea sp. NPDC047897]|uniref:S1 family peptidase n=1 Tax=Nonomuraea sp. NPDC047897 TaxID=3364346 RepID=UPI00371554B2
MIALMRLRLRGRGTIMMIAAVVLLLLPTTPAMAAFAATPGIPDRPTLTKLFQQAERTGTTLEQELDGYVAQQVALGRGGPYRGNPMGAPDDDLPTLPPDLVIDGIPLAELVDLKLIAKSEGISFADAIDRFAWQSQFVKAADQIERAFPGDFAGAVFAHDGRSGWFAFKGPVPAAAQSIAKALPRPTRTFADRGFSEAELKQTLDHAHDTVMAQPDVVSVAGSYEIRTGVITLEVQVKGTTSRAGVWAATLQEQLTPANPKISINISMRDALPGGNEDTYMRGGGYLGDCTAGFTLRNADRSWHGVSTAHHCPGTYRTYVQHSGQGGDSTSTTRRGEHAGTYGDLAWYTRGSLTVARTFYYDWSSTRYVDDVWSPRTGVRVCKFGITTGAECNETYQLNTTRDNYKGLVAIHRHITQGGDSGGPWYYGATAFGIHSGWKNINLLNRSQFTPARNINQFGLYIHER